MLACGWARSLIRLCCLSCEGDAQVHSLMFYSDQLPPLQPLLFQSTLRGYPKLQACLCKILQWMIVTVATEPVLHTKQSPEKIMRKSAKVVEWIQMLWVDLRIHPPSLESSIRSVQRPFQFVWAGKFTDWGKGQQFSDLRERKMPRNCPLSSYTRRF